MGKNIRLAGDKYVQGKRFTPLERELKQRLFIKMLYDMGRYRTKAEICQEVGISPDTYNRWKSDVGMRRLYEVEQFRVDGAVKEKVNLNQTTALDTLVDVMDNSRNDMARVKASELMLTLGQAMARSDSAQDEADSKDVARIISQGPTLIVANAGMLIDIQRKVNASRVVEVFDDAIDGEATIVD